jgi:hypothetical protein
MIKRILSPISNRADWTSSYEVVDDTDGTDVDLSSATIVFAINDPYDCDNQIKGTIAIPSLGFFNVSFTRDQLKELNGTYDLGCTIEISSVTTQFIVGRLPIIDGFVPE